MIVSEIESKRRFVCYRGASKGYFGNGYGQLQNNAIRLTTKANTDTAG